MSASSNSFTIECEECAWQSMVALPPDRHRWWACVAGLPPCPRPTPEGKCGGRRTPIDFLRAARKTPGPVSVRG